MRLLLAVCVGVALATLTLLAPAHAHADTQCPYPGIGVLGFNVGPIAGGWCDFPVEINGSHWHCEGGGVNLGLGILGNGASSSASLGFAQSGAGIAGLSCTWRCPDGQLAPPPNPPGMWREYLVPMNTTNFCKDHMEPNGFWSAPTLPTEGIPPANEQAPAPGQTLPPQPVPPPQPTVAPGEPLIPPLAPGEPNP